MAKQRKTSRQGEANSTFSRLATRATPPAVTSEAKWRSPANLIAAVAALVALAAMATSLYSLSLSEADFESARRLILVGTASKDSDWIELKSVDPSVSLQRATVIMPLEISGEPWDVLPPDYHFFTTVFRLQLSREISKSVSRKEGIVSVSIGVSVPIVIKSTYTAKGGSYDDRSLYSVIFDFVADDKPANDPVLTIRGVEFVRRLSAEEQTKTVVEQIWHIVQARPN